jgi:IPT/TIG domain
MHAASNARRLVVRGSEMAIPRSSRLCLLTISLALVCSSCGVCPPPPVISSISPNNTAAGGNQFVLTVNGSDFRHDSSVSWNGSLRATTFVSSRQLKAAVTAAARRAASRAARAARAHRARAGGRPRGTPPRGRAPRAPLALSCFQGRKCWML